jgi:hypothetical protein
MAKDTSGAGSTKKRKNAAHERLITDIFINYGATGYLRIFKANTGVFNIRGRIIRAFFPGMTDLWGFTSNGRIVFCEVKTGRGSLTKQQDRFKNLVEAFNCHYLLCRSLKQFGEFFHTITTGCTQVILTQDKDLH